jgi:hypothetical protein
MQHSSNDTRPAAPKVPWNKGKIIGARPPLQTKRRGTLTGAGRALWLSVNRPRH